MATRMPTGEAPRIVTAQHLIRALPVAAHRTRPERAQVIPAPMARVRRTPSMEERATRTRTAAQLRAKPATARHTPRPTERRQLPPPTIRPPALPTMVTIRPQRSAITEQAATTAAQDPLRAPPLWEW